MNLILLKQSEYRRITKQAFGSHVDFKDLRVTGVVDLPPNDERTKHIRSHLKKMPGDKVSVGLIRPDGGCRGKASVFELQNGGIRLVPHAETMIASPRLPEITLILAVPFPSRLKYLWPVMASFATVSRIVIVRGKLSNPEFCQSSALRPSVYEPMIEAGMSQGGRTRPIKVDICVEDESISKKLLERLGIVGNNSAADGIARIFLDCGDENATPPPARDVVTEQCGNKDNNSELPSAILAVGPERGWTDEEADIFVKQCCFSSAMIGSSILRVDTAVVAGLAVVSAALDECSHTKSDRADCKRRRQDCASDSTELKR